MSIDNMVLDGMSDQIKCENYVTLCIHFIRMRTILRERIVTIEEKQSKLWNEYFNITFEEHDKPKVLIDISTYSMIQVQKIKSSIVLV